MPDSQALALRVGIERHSDGMSRHNPPTSDRPENTVKGLGVEPDFTSRTELLFPGVEPALCDVPSVGYALDMRQSIPGSHPLLSTWFNEPCYLGLQRASWNLAVRLTPFTTAL